MKTIPLTNTSNTVVIDNKDYDFLSQFRWRSKKSHGTVEIEHAVRDVTIGNKKVTVRMHRLITEADSDQVVFHLNGNGLDNRRSNLQLRTINPWTGRPDECGFIGVNQTGPSKWEAVISFAGNTYNLGEFDDPEYAAETYDAAARSVYGTHAVVNFQKNKVTARAA